MQAVAPGVVAPSSSPLPVFPPFPVVGVVLAAGA